MNKNFSILGMVFFLWGNITAFTSVLIIFFYQYFALSWQQSIWITVVFYLAPFLACLPCSRAIAWWGYRRMLLLALCGTAVGSLLLALALWRDAFLAALMAMFIVATGVAAMQVVANPYLALLSAPQRRISNLCLASAVNSLGTTLAPLVVALSLRLAPFDAVAREQPISLLWLAIALLSLLLSGAIIWFRLPDVACSQTSLSPGSELRRHRPVLYSVAAIFIYVGVEVALATSLVKYFMVNSGWSMAFAMSLVSFYWGGALLGRLGYGYMAKSVNHGMAFSAATLGCAVAVALAAILNNDIGGWLLILTGAGNAILYPIIFGHTIDKYPAIAHLAAAAMVMAGIGGAVIPWLQAICIERLSLSLSFFFLSLLYLVLMVWGWRNLGARS